MCSIPRAAPTRLSGENPSPSLQPEVAQNVLGRVGSVCFGGEKRHPGLVGNGSCVCVLCILNSPLPYSYEAGILENPKVSLFAWELAACGSSPRCSCYLTPVRPNWKFHEGPA